MFEFYAKLALEQYLDSSITLNVRFCLRSTVFFRKLPSKSKNPVCKIQSYVQGFFLQRYVNIEQPRNILSKTSLFLLPSILFNHILSNSMNTWLLVGIYYVFTLFLTVLIAGVQQQTGFVTPETVILPQ